MLGELKRGEASNIFVIGSLRGAKPLFRKNLPLPLDKGKGIKGIGFPNKNLKRMRLINHEFY